MLRRGGTTGSINEGPVRFSGMFVFYPLILFCYTALRLLPGLPDALDGFPIRLATPSEVTRIVLKTGSE